MLYVIIFMLLLVTIIKSMPAFSHYIFVTIVAVSATRIAASFRISMLGLTSRWSSLHVWLWLVSVGRLVDLRLCMIITVAIRQVSVAPTLLPCSLSVTTIRGGQRRTFLEASISQSLTSIILKLHLEFSINIICNLGSMFPFSE